MVISIPYYGIVVVVVVEEIAATAIEITLIWNVVCFTFSNESTK